MAERAPAPKKQLGQHFLYDPNILNKIVRLAEVGEGCPVLEIGPGPGGLTRALLAHGAKVWAVETDPRMVEHLSANKPPELTLIKADALRTDYLALAAQAGGRLKIVANLPYNISGPLLATLLRQRAAFTDMTLMFQREVAERIAAGPGGKERGVLSVLAQAFCDVKMGFRVSPGAFRPPPKVDSALIRLVVKDDCGLTAEEEETLWASVHEAFQKRRKQLRNCLKQRVADAETFYASVNLTGSERPEELPTAKWIELAKRLPACG